MTLRMQPTQSFGVSFPNLPGILMLPAQEQFQQLQVWSPVTLFFLCPAGAYSIQLHSTYRIDRIRSKMKQENIRLDCWTCQACSCLISFISLDRPAKLKKWLAALQWFYGQRQCVASLGASRCTCKPNNDCESKCHAVIHVRSNESKVRKLRVHISKRWSSGNRSDSCNFLHKPTTCNCAIVCWTRENLWRESIPWNCANTFSETGYGFSCPSCLKHLSSHFHGRGLQRMNSIRIISFLNMLPWISVPSYQTHVPHIRLNFRKIFNHSIEHGPRATMGRPHPNQLSPCWGPTSWQPGYESWSHMYITKTDMMIMHCKQSLIWA